MTSQYANMFWLLKVSMARKCLPEALASRVSTMTVSACVCVQIYAVVSLFD